MVRVPRRVQDLHLRIGAVVSELSQQLGRSPTPREIADAAGVRDEDVLEALDAGQPLPAGVARSRREQRRGRHPARARRQRARVGRGPRHAPTSAAPPPRARAARGVHALLRGHDPGGDRRGDRREPDARVETPHVAVSTRCNASSRRILRPSSRRAAPAPCGALHRRRGGRERVAGAGDLLVQHRRHQLARLEVRDRERPAELRRAIRGARSRSSSRSPALPSCTSSRRD